jgi:hypothetical protein
MNNVYFVEKGGVSEPTVLCDRHAQEEVPFDAVSEALEETDDPCVVCFEQTKEEMLEIAAEIIDTDGRGLRTYLGLLAGLLEARAEAGDEYEDVFRAALSGVERAAANVIEIEIDNFDEGDAVEFTRDVARPPRFTVPSGARGRIVLLRGKSVCVNLDRTISGHDSEDYDTVWFDGDDGHDHRTEFLDSVRKVGPPA